MLTQCSTIFRMFCSMSKSVEALAVVVPSALVPGWADTRAICEGAAVELSPALVPDWADKTAAYEEMTGALPPALVPGWAGVISTCEALPWENWSILVAIVARAVVRVPSVCLNSIMMGLSSILVSSSLDWNSGGG